MYVANAPCKNYNTDEQVIMFQLVYKTIALLQVKNLLDELEFVTVPLVNPDGYVVRLCTPP